MPNWAASNYFFYSKNKNLVQDFLVTLNTWVNEESLYPDVWDRDPRWLGNILGHAGFPKDEIYEDKHGRCCGEITYLGNNVFYNDKKKYYYFNLGTETAWATMPVMWKNIINKLYPNTDLNFCYFCSEPGCEVFDIYNKETYIKLTGMKYVSGDKCYYLQCYFETLLDILEGDNDIPEWFKKLVNDYKNTTEDFYSSTDELIELIKDIPIDEPDLRSSVKDKKSCARLNEKITKKLQEYDNYIVFKIIIVREVESLD